MTDTDTRAALDAAIDDWRRLRGLTYLTGGAQAAQAARDRVDRAITAHVEAEVTRRLACAPSVETALAAYGTAVYELGYVLHRPDRDAVLRPVKDTAEATLRAAIAADRERAVAAGRVEVQLLRDALRYVDAWGCVPGSGTEWLAKNNDRVADGLRGALAGSKARPTPDEARRMINELIGSMAVVGNGLDDSPGAVVAKRIAADARTALLRALGVEA